MMQPIFVLGRPGSGKSTVCRYLSEKMPAQHLAGFPILLEMFGQEQYRHYFLPHERYGGFVIIDDAIWPIMEQEMAQRANLLFQELQGCLLIELVRGCYEKSILYFSEMIRQSAYALYLNMPLALCQERIAARVASDEEDRHATPPEFIARHCIEQHLPGTDVIPAERLIHLDNTGSREQLYAQLDRFLEILKGSATLEQSTYQPEDPLLQEQATTHTT